MTNVLLGLIVVLLAANLALVWGKHFHLELGERRRLTQEREMAARMRKAHREAFERALRPESEVRARARQDGGW